MKTLKAKTLGLVILLSIFCTTNTNANEPHIASYLSVETEQHFENFMNKNARRFIRKNQVEWANFIAVVKLNNEAQGKFQSLSQKDQETFILASNKISKKLSEMKNPDANIWLQKVNATEKIILFLWSIKTEERELEEFIEIPKIEMVLTASR